MIKIGQVIKEKKLTISAKVSIIHALKSQKEPLEDKTQNYLITLKFEHSSMPTMIAKQSKNIWARKYA